MGMERHMKDPTPSTTPTTLSTTTTTPSTSTTSLSITTTTPSAKTTATTTTTTTTLQGCPSGWTEFGSNCYKLYYNQLNWEEAENYCKGQGGHLASVHSAEENNFLFGLTQV